MSAGLRRQGRAASADDGPELGAEGVIDPISHVPARLLRYGTSRVVAHRLYLYSRADSVRRNTTTIWVLVVSKPPAALPAAARTRNGASAAREVGAVCRRWGLAEEEEEEEMEEEEAEEEEERAAMVGVGTARAAHIVAMVPHVRAGVGTAAGMSGRRGGAAYHILCRKSS